MFASTQETRNFSLFKLVPTSAFSHLDPPERIAAHRNVVTDRKQIALFSAILALDSIKDSLSAPNIAFSLGATALGIYHATQALFHRHEARELQATTQPAG